ncbi:F-box and WD repeat domain containing protein 10B [Phascolarctos cinereus]|uniref:CMT1A duplicated region transcript 1 protein n=1 Tax=Phascolarctos cinereus TaxID=38626 RepID=A0A6P5IUM2_PHACI|nr:CMT1A duplicated region transcript 1 protein [Phascolarctos cinereus]
MEKLEFRLDCAPDLRCEQKTEYLPMCQKCETCVLAWKIFSTREWFCRISERSQQKFLVRILKRLKSLELLDYFEKVLSTSQGKEFTYFRCRAIIDRKTDKKITCSKIKKVDEKAKDAMLDTLRWFGNSSYRTKVHYTLLLLQLCDSSLLFNAASVIRFLIVRQQRTGGVDLEEDSDVSSPDSLNESHHNCEIASSRSHTSSFSRTSKSQVIFVGKGQTEDFNFSDGRSHAPPPLHGEMFSDGTDGAMEDEDFTVHLPSPPDYRKQLPEISKGKDFIRYFPVHISKYILGLLDKKTLNKCVLVSRHWSLVVEEVKKDQAAQQHVENEITLLRETYSKGLYPNYASRPGIPVPKIDEDDKTTHSKNSKWKLKSKVEYSIWAAYQGQETVTVQMEERNVFCGNYSTRILSDRWDNSRVIHFCGGKFVAITANRKILLLDINQIHNVPTYFRGNAGNVQALILCEKESFVLSGSYDLSIRYWNTETGLCTKIFNGHMGTITCLDSHENKLVSGSKDCQVKVWDINTGRCLKTFKHKDPVMTAKISSTYIVSGCEQGLVKVWHLASATLVKTLNGHEGPVKCLCFDEWHLLTGSNDGFVMGWSMVGKYERCLMAFKHPREVLCVAFLYLRVISGCADGKIRIYNFLNGTCLKVMKANSRGDPVLSFFIEGNRMVINTESNVVTFEFEEVKWQYYSDKNKLLTKKPKEKEKENNASSAKEYRASYPKKNLETEAKYTGDIFETHRPVTVETSEAALQRIKKQGLQLPLSPDQLLLTVSSLQQTHTASYTDHLHIPKVNVRDAWGPTVLQQETSNNFLDLKDMSLLPGRAEQAAQIKKLKSASIAPGFKRSSTPFEIQKLQPNLKKSLHSSKVCSHIPQPMTVRPKSCETLKDGEERVHTKRGNLTSANIIKPNRMMIRNTGESSCPQVKPPTYAVTANPYRVNTGFMLLTVKQKKEYNEAQMGEYKNMQPIGTANPDKASKVAWLRKIKGLSIDDFMKKGKTAAPEFGRKSFI